MSQPLQAAILAAARPLAVVDMGRAQLAAALEQFDEADWTTFIERALAHGTTSLVCRNLLALDVEFLPAELMAACEAHLAASEAAAVRALTQLAEVIDALAANGIDALPYKGPILALQAYGDPAVRESRDLDLLIRQDDLWNALAVLGRLGYRSDSILGLRPRRIADYYAYNGHDILFAQDKLPIEPHWALAPRTFCTELDTARIFDRAISIETAEGRRFSCFAPEDSLLTAAIHGGKEQWSRLLWVADVAGLLHAHALDWAAVLERAREAGCLRMTLLAAELARDLLGARLPDHVQRSIREDRVVARLVERVRADLFTQTAAPSVFTLTQFRWHLRERPADRWRYAARTLFVARVPHFRNIDLPDWLSFLYPAVRLGHDFVMMPTWKALARSGALGALKDSVAGWRAPSAQSDDQPRL
jgi:hypothetical protein